jgi:hypothetical protein
MFGNVSADQLSQTAQETTAARLGGADPPPGQLGRRPALGEPVRRSAVAPDPEAHQGVWGRRD